MPSFHTSYTQLNPAQRQAVDTIDGPVMVVAGPGTGKTQLLSMRVANILRQTDTSPQNILCLTFTESGAQAMRQRLVGLIGPEGYKVAIHTFHSFGTEVINHYPDYFYQGANFRPADELTSFEVLEPLFAKLPHTNPLAATMNGEFTALRDVKTAIGHLKKAGLTPDELLKILDHNDAFVTFAEPLLARAFDVPRLGKKDIARCQQVADELDTFADTPPPIALWKPLASICRRELEQAAADATEQTSTKPLTAWRNRWLERDAKKQYVFKDRARSKKLRAMADVYYNYLLAMQAQQLFDFDDMILRVLHALEYFPELRYNLQEQYQYVLVDEFQDTNGAQLRLLQNLLSAEANNGRPNIMVVGDDDQAIYAFQGAEIGNILQFRQLYRDPVIITLTENYRSTSTILASARSVITQGVYRLETALDAINKTLRAHNTHTPTHSQLHQFTNPTQQYQWVTQTIAQHIAEGAKPSSIAVLARSHSQLFELLPFVRQAGIHVSYERRNNVLQAEHIQALVALAQAVTSLADQRFDVVDALLPQLLSYEFWGLKTADLWQLSLAAHKQHKLWLELMLERDDRLRAIAEFLIVASHQAQHEPVEQLLDTLIGSTELQAADSTHNDSDSQAQTAPIEAFTSPFRAHYFNAGRLEQNPADYLTMLSNLAVIRHKLREYRPGQTLLLGDFVDFVELHQKTNLPIVDNAEHRDTSQAITLMTAHKAKGLEFDSVFVLGCQDSIWGSSARHHSSSITFPHNLAITPAGQSLDDCLRLFFVAMTRAKHQLYLCTYQAESSGKPSMPAAFLAETIQPIAHAAHASAEQLAQTLEPTWQSRHVHHMPAIDKRQLLQPRLDSYELSATHLNNFIDVTTGGPQAFLLQNLLRFPQAMTRSAAFGSAIHAVLQRAHVHLTHTGERRPTEDILQDFELQLQHAHLGEQDLSYLLEKGSSVLQAYLAERHNSFTPGQKVEYTLHGVMIGPARLSGTLDLLHINESAKTIIVTDYKTGKAPHSWQGNTEYEKIKLHKYRQQLMLYKLLIENSREFAGTYTVERAVLEFVEPSSDGNLQQLELSFDPAELARFTKLVQAIWQRIITLDLPDISGYEANYKGIVGFEEDLLQVDKKS